MRKTQAMLNAERIAANHVEFEKTKAEYPQRLMKVMAEYSQLPRFSVKKNGSNVLSFDFDVTDSDGDNCFDVVLPAEMLTLDNLYDLESAERMVVVWYAVERERDRRYEVFKAAQVKAKEIFTEEERELLGIK